MIVVPWFPELKQTGIARATMRHEQCFEITLQLYIGFVPQYLAASSKLSTKASSIR
jgi:hypothetical protein